MLTTTGVDVVVFPAASRATAVIEWSPFDAVVEFQLPSYGAVVSSGPALVPSTLNCTPATPTLSVASAARLTVPVTGPAIGLVTFTVGASVSEGGADAPFRARIAAPLIEPV